MTEGEKMEDTQETEGPRGEVTCLESGQLLKHHGKYMCTGECCLHGTSPYEFCRKPRLWRSDRGIIEHLCPHGIGHPCAAGLAHAKAMEALGRGYGGDGVHGCDGCCTGEGPETGPEQLKTPVLTLPMVWAKVCNHDKGLEEVAQWMKGTEQKLDRHSDAIYKLKRDLAFMAVGITVVSVLITIVAFTMD